MRFRTGVIRLNEEQWTVIKYYLPEQPMECPRSRDKECFKARDTLRAKNRLSVGNVTGRIPA